MARRSVAPVARRGQAAAVHAPVPTQTAHPAALMVPVDQLVADPGQPRRHFDEEALVELADSIKQQGVLQPLLVREDGSLPDGRSRYVIIAGGRRHRAAQIAGVVAIPVIVHAETGGPELRILQLIENLQREDLDALEEAVAIRELMQLANLSLDGVAARIGKTKAYAQRRVDLLYDPRLVDAVRRGAINASVAVELRYFSEEQRSRYLDRIAAGERLEVAQLREEKRRAREILFGDAGRRSAGAGNKSHNGGQHLTAESPHANQSYRFDTTSGTQHLAAEPPRDDLSYRIDTIAGTSDSSMSPDNVVVQEPGSQSSGMLAELVDENVMGWAAALAEIIAPHAPDSSEHAALVTALQAWHRAGSPPAWGTALLQALDERISDP